MKKKNKGFTMVELLAVITIMGILTALAVPAVTKYIVKGRNQSYETMFKSTYEAAENYMMDEAGLISVGATKTIIIADLVNQQYLEPLIDPGSKNNASCAEDSDDPEEDPDDAESKVVVKRLANSDGGIPNYQYTIYIKCPSFSEVKSETFPK